MDLRILNKGKIITSNNNLLKHIYRWNNDNDPQIPEIGKDGNIINWN